MSFYIIVVSLFICSCCSDEINPQGFVGKWSDHTIAYFEKVRDGKKYNDTITNYTLIVILNPDGTGELQRSNPLDTAYIKWFYNEVKNTEHSSEVV